MIGDIFSTIWNFAVFMFVVFIFVLWLWLLISVIGDLFRRDDVGGFGKVLWILFLLFLPYLGVFLYILTQGKSMGERNMAQAAAARDQLRQVVGFSVADELEKLGRLKAAGTLTEAEYAAAKSKLIA
jgi:hypothetical protein